MPDEYSPFAGILFSLATNGARERRLHRMQEVFTQIHAILGTLEPLQEPEPEPEPHPPLGR